MKVLKIAITSLFLVGAVSAQSKQELLSWDFNSMSAMNAERKTKQTAWWAPGPVFDCPGGIGCRNPVSEQTAPGKDRAFILMFATMPTKIAHWVHFDVPPEKDTPSTTETKKEDQVEQSSAPEEE